MEENVDSISYSSDTPWWIFHVQGGAYSVSEEYHELLDITKKMFGIFNDFFIPTEIRYDLCLCSEDFPAFDIVSFKRSCSHMFVRDLTSNNGLFFNNILNDIKNIDYKGMSRYLGDFILMERLNLY